MDRERQRRFGEALAALGARIGVDGDLVEILDAARTRANSWTSAAIRSSTRRTRPTSTATW